MARFCTKCGKPLADGEVCACTQNTVPPQQNYGYQAPQGGYQPHQSGYQPYQGGYQPHQGGYQNPDLAKMNAEAAKGFFESMKNRMGIGDPESNKSDAFESGKSIVPDCIKAGEGEVPIKQYTLATMRNRFLGISFTKAMAKLQITNKRVLFRAPGRTLTGRISQHQEFQIEDIAGIESKRQKFFSIWELLLGLIVMTAGGAVTGAIVGSLLWDNHTIAIILGLLFGIGGCVPFFMVKRMWLLKLLCLGAGLFGMLATYSVVLMILAIPILAVSIIALMLYSNKDNLTLVIKTKIATDAIYLRPSSPLLRHINNGFAEVLPTEEAEAAIRELKAILEDVKADSDSAVQKWTT